MHLADLESKLQEHLQIQYDNFNASLEAGSIDYNEFGPVGGDHAAFLAASGAQQNRHVD